MKCNSFSVDIRLTCKYVHCKNRKQITNTIMMLLIICKLFRGPHCFPTPDRIMYFLCFYQLILNVNINRKRAFSKFTSSSAKWVQNNFLPIQNVVRQISMSYNIIICRESRLLNKRRKGAVMIILLILGSQRWALEYPPGLFTAIKFWLFGRKCR